MGGCLLFVITILLFAVVIGTPALLAALNAILGIIGVVILACVVIVLVLLMVVSIDDIIVPKKRVSTDFIFMDTQVTLEAGDRRELARKVEDWMREHRIRFYGVTWSDQYLFITYPGQEGRKLTILEK